MEDIPSIRAIALRNVLKSDSEEYLTRKIYRSYSKAFHTPLHVVEELPEYDVFLHFFEDMYESMEAKEREAEVDDILLTDEEADAQRRREDADEAELFEINRDIIAEEGNLDKIKLPKEGNAMVALKKLSKEVELAVDSFKTEIEPGIQMVFEDNWDESDFEADSFGILENPKKT